ncbi:MAG TPA: hypothetical protein VF189_02190 [Patescibacteria group bacterium]
MDKKRFVDIHHASATGNEGGVRLPEKGIFEQLPTISPTEFENADTASPKKWGGRRVENQDKRALIVHPEFPLGYS